MINHLDISVLRERACSGMHIVRTDCSVLQKCSVTCGIVWCLWRSVIGRQVKCVCVCVCVCVKRVLGEKFRNGDGGSEWGLAKFVF